MNTVEPIRSKETFNDIAEYLRSRSERNYVLFMTGIYTGLRISDILKLRVRDVKGKDYIFFREKKTGKEKRIPILRDLKVDIESYTQNMEDYEYLFASRNGINKPIGRVMAYKILSEAAEVFGLDSIGCHTMRKTFGYMLYQETKDVEAIRQILNHSNASVTLRYIGVNQQNNEKAMKRLEVNSWRKR